jgi:sugar/nucleoside kinase (ribokinase family)
VTDVLVVGGIFREIIAFDGACQQRLGGSGLTAATAARALGAAVALAGAVGREDEDDVRGLLDRTGITGCLSVTAGRSGTFAFPTNESAEQPWPLYRPAEGEVTTRPEVPNADVVALFGVPDFDAVADGWVDDACRDAIVLWDRQGWLSRARDDAHVLALAAAVQVYVANAVEAAEDAGADEVWALDHQPPPGYAAALIKRGPDGVIVYHADAAEGTEIPSFNVSVTSTVGSGDAFAGAAAAVLAAGGDIVDAARMGCAIAAALIEQGENIVNEAMVERARLLLAE